MGGSDFHRTRLTHSLETAQIAQGIVGRLMADPEVPEAARIVLPPPALIEAVALAHDLGHPPFGHGGEVALNWCMRDAGGFEGNGQTLRLISRLEAHSGAFGLDLARRTLIGVLKYPVAHSRFGPPVNRAEGGMLRAADWKPAKCYFDIDEPIVAWMLDPFDAAERALFTRPDAAGGNRAFDTSILELADDVAYGVHDLEDAIALALLGQEHVFALWTRHRAAIVALEGAPADRDIAALFADDSARKRAIGLLVNFFIIHIEVRREPHMASPLLAWRAALPEAVFALLNALIALIRRQVIARPVVQMLEYRGQEIVRRVFETIAADPERFLPAPWLDRWQHGSQSGEGLRTICDYVAAMTDEQATRNYQLLFSPRGGITFGVQ